MHQPKKKILLITFACVACFLATAQKNDTVTTASGLKYFFTKKGKGRLLQPGEVAVWHYELSFTDGTPVESSRERKSPMGSKIPTSRMIKGTSEALLLMHTGDRGVFIFPPALGYGQRGARGNGSRPDIPPNATLVFDMELTDIKKISLLDTLQKTLYTQPAGDTSTPHVAEMLALFKELRTGKNISTVFSSDDDLNTIGYQLLPKYPEDALKVFLLNVEAYPEVSNVYDSLGEAYMNLNDFSNAILNYEKSLKLDPANTNAVEQIKQMKAKRAKVTREG